MVPDKCRFAYTYFVTGKEDKADFSTHTQKQEGAWQVVWRAETAAPQPPTLLDPPSNPVKGEAANDDLLSIPSLLSRKGGGGSRRSGTHTTTRVSSELTRFSRKINATVDTCIQLYSTLK
jgi:hypothetical protein